MLNEKGEPREIDLVILRRKLGGIAKGKAPGYSGNGPDLYASLPGSWAVWAVRLANLILFTQVTPHNWHIDLVHYVHKGGVDGSLPNHRPLALVEVFRKVVTPIVCDRLEAGLCATEHSRSRQPRLSNRSHLGELHLPAADGRRTLPPHGNGIVGSAW